MMGLQMMITNDQTSPNVLFWVEANDQAEWYNLQNNLYHKNFQHNAHQMSCFELKRMIKLNEVTFKVDASADGRFV